MVCCVQPHISPVSHRRLLVTDEMLNNFLLIFDIGFLFGYLFLNALRIGVVLEKPDLTDV